MNETSTIIPQAAPPDISRYNKCIASARIALFIYAGLAATSGWIMVYLGTSVSSGTYTIAGWLTIGMSATLVVLSLLSIRKPYIPLLAGATIIGGYLLWQLYSDLATFNAPESVRGPALIAAGFSTFVQILILYFLVRGVMFARKKKELLVSQSGS